MLKIFFITFFISEIIIALAVILQIHKFNKCVICLNEIVLATKGKIKIGFTDLRLIFEEFNKGLVELKEFINKKRDEYIKKILTTSLTYGSILLLKGKYKKTVLAYQVLKEIYEGVTEA